MVHPIINNRLYIGLYYIFWLVISFGHFWMNREVFEAGVWTSLLDSLIFNLSFSLLGLAHWYSVRFSQMEKYSTSTLVFQHLGLAAVNLVVILAISYYSANGISLVNGELKALYDQSVIWKVINGIWYYAMITMVYYVIMYYTNFKRKMIRESELKDVIQKSELSILKSQINPHFLFNSLNSISALTIKDPPKARDMIFQLSDFLRYTIHDNENNMTVFEKEIEVLSNYLAIEKVRFSERLQVKEDVDESCLGAKLPSMILQPIIENAVKYGVAQNTNQSTIEISSCCFQGYLKVQIQNNYDTEVKLKKGTGIGIKNITQRMELHYGRKDLVQISNKDGIFTVIITFPQINDN